MKIVASLTTMPDRINLIRPVLESLNKQSVVLHHIEINVPYRCIRTGQDYVIPSWLETFSNLIIHRTEDYGAITKVAPTLLRYMKDEETFIWSVDDDIVYPPYLLRTLVHYHSPVKRVLAHKVGNISVNGFYAINSFSTGMVLEGFGTVLYPIKCVNDDFLAYVELTSSIPDCRVSDDIVISNYMFKENLSILNCPLINNNKTNIHDFVLPYYKDTHATHLQSGGHDKRYVRVLHHLKNNNILYWRYIFDKKPRKISVQPVQPVQPKTALNFASNTSNQTAGKRFWG